MSHIVSCRHCDSPLYSSETKGLGSLPSSNRFLESNVQVFATDNAILSQRLSRFIEHVVSLCQVNTRLILLYAHGIIDCRILHHTAESLFVIIIKKLDICSLSLTCHVTRDAYSFIVLMSSITDIRLQSHSE